MHVSFSLCCAFNKRSIIIFISVNCDMKFWSQTAWLNEGPSFFNLGLIGSGLGLMTFHKMSPKTHHNYL